MTNSTNPQMPEDPGAPESTDEQYVSPDQAETLAEEAADSAALEGEEDPIGEISDAEIEDALAAEHEPHPDADGDGVVSEVELQLAERTEDLQRVSAEYANYRRRTERERSQIVEQAKAQVLSQLFPLLDDLDLADQHGDLTEGPLRAFSDKFRAVVDGQKVVAFGEEGEAFDPEIHEAVQDLSQGETKIIGTVLRKGYRIGDRLARNAMVIIADPDQPSATSTPAGEPEA